MQLANQEDRKRQNKVHNHFSTNYDKWADNEQKLKKLRLNILRDVSAAETQKNKSVTDICINLSGVLGQPYFWFTAIYT